MGISQTKGTRAVRQRQISLQKISLTKNNRLARQHQTKKNAQQEIKDNVQHLNVKNPNVQHLNVKNPNVAATATVTTVDVAAVEAIKKWRQKINHEKRN